MEYRYPLNRFKESGSSIQLCGVSRHIQNYRRLICWSKIGIWKFTNLIALWCYCWSLLDRQDYRLCGLKVPVSCLELIVILDSEIFTPHARHLQMIAIDASWQQDMSLLGLKSDQSKAAESIMQPTHHGLKCQKKITGNAYTSHKKIKINKTKFCGLYARTCTNS